MALDLEARQVPFSVPREWNGVESRSVIPVLSVVHFHRRGAIAQV